MINYANFKDEFKVQPFDYYTLVEEEKENAAPKKQTNRFELLGLFYHQAIIRKKGINNPSKVFFV